MTNSDPDRRIGDAYEQLAEDAAYVRAPDTPRLRTRPVWVVPALVAGLLIVAGVIGVVALSTDGDDSKSIVAGQDTTSTPHTEPRTTAPLRPTVDEDLYYPWVYPPPYLAYYEEGCPTPDSVVRDFAANAVEDPDPVVTVLMDEPDRVDVLIHAKGEGGSVLDTGSIATVVRVDPGSIVGCDAWGVLSVTAADDVTIDEPTSSSTVGIDVGVSGTGRGFESQIDLRVIDDRYETVGEGFAQGGWELEPYSGSVVLDDQPLDGNLIVIAQSSGAADGAIEPFAAVKVRYDGTEILPASESGSAGSPAAVVGVEPDDTLNVRSGPGVSSDVVGVVSPYDSELLIQGVGEIVGEDRWIPVTHASDLDIRGWANEEFITPIEDRRAVIDVALYEALTEVRGALSLNASGERLADLLASTDTSTLTISDDGYFDGSDTVLTIEDLWDGDAQIDEIVSSTAIGEPGRIIVETEDTPPDNATAFFPGSTFITLLDGPRDPDGENSTVRLVFLPHRTEWVLAGMALG